MNKLILGFVFLIFLSTAFGDEGVIENPDPRLLEIAERYIVSNDIKSIEYLQQLSSRVFDDGDYWKITYNLSQKLPYLSTGGPPVIYI